MRYLCIEDNVVTATMTYEPAVPDTVRIVTITDSEYQKLADRTHYFDPVTDRVLPRTADMLAADDQAARIAEARRFLSDTDWKVLRHVREQALGKTTTLSQDEYLALERERDAAAELIR
jgi:hypothetical protein